MKSNYDPKNPICQACCTAIVDYQEIWWCKHVLAGGLQMIVENCKDEGYQLNLVCKIERIKLQIERLEGYPDKMLPESRPKGATDSGLIERYTMGFCERCKKEYEIDWSIGVGDDNAKGAPPCPVCGSHYAEITAYFRMRKDKAVDKNPESEALSE